MPREYATYRLFIEQLNAAFPDRGTLTRKDIMAFTGMSLGTIRTRYPFYGQFCQKVDFARMLARESPTNAD